LNPQSQGNKYTTSTTWVISSFFTSSLTFLHLSLFFLQVVRAPLLITRSVTILRATACSVQGISVCCAFRQKLISSTILLSRNSLEVGTLTSGKALLTDACKALNILAYHHDSCMHYIFIRILIVDVVDFFVTFDYL
jgi:hypothetical protein